MSTPPKHNEPSDVTLSPDSEEAVSFIDATKAALPASFTLKDICVLLAAGVCEAYAAYNNGNNHAPKLDGYKWFNPIYVWESLPNGNPFSTAEGQAQAIAGVGTAQDALPSRAAAYASRVGEAPQCTGPIPPGTPVAGSQLFGFTATANDESHNILVYRGTVTMEEAGYDLLGWGTNINCMLPSQWWEPNNYGPVNSYLFAFYVNKGTNWSSLASSTMDAIQKTMNLTTQKNLPWFLGGHSLGGAMITLAALDAVASTAFGTQSLPFVITFGSLHVGDQTFADLYKPEVPLTGRIANLCDFVPSMVSLEPVTLPDPYVHVGTPGTFVWQKWDDWANHSLSGVYQPMVQSHWETIHWGSRKYPQ
jgi:triacylglycerol lipase